MIVFAINPGSTSTKVALIEMEYADAQPKVIVSANVPHDAKVLDQYQTLKDQYPYRLETIEKILEEKEIDLSQVDAFVGRGGGLISMEGGTYEVTDFMMKHGMNGANGVIHPANLGTVLAGEFAKKFKKPAFTVNPPDVDELQDIARVTGLKGVNRVIHLHALNLKETAIRHAAFFKEQYKDNNYVVCHIGGGISVSAHRQGKMVDGYDIVGGEGPMAPTRSGSISVIDLLNYIKENSLDDAKKICTKTGGLVNHLGTSDALEVSQRAKAGDAYAKLVWDAMIYQIEKCIGAMAVVLRGKVDGILLGGGMVHNKELVADIREACEFIAPVYDYPGEFEMEAMASGAVRVLCGKEEIKQYTGKPCWSGFQL